MIVETFLFSLFHLVSGFLALLIFPSLSLRRSARSTISAQIPLRMTDKSSRPPAKRPERSFFCATLMLCFHHLFPYGCRQFVRAGQQRRLYTHGAPCLGEQQRQQPLCLHVPCHQSCCYVPRLPLLLHLLQSAATAAMLQARRASSTKSIASESKVVCCFWCFWCFFLSDLLVGS